jgi:ABC-2 type transport system ATP-binding protein
MDETRTILITTHQVEEIENLLTDAIFIDKGRIVLQSTLDDIGERYIALVCALDKVGPARACKPFYERNTLGKTILYFEGIERDRLGGFGELHTPSIADLFVAKLSGSAA